jgi:hypothetical protein
MAGTAGQEPDLGMAARSGIGLENTLKVETGFESRWDYGMSPDGCGNR